jgi:hypothetical protein
MDSELKQYLDNLNERIDGLGAQTAAEFRQMREENAGEFRQMREENASAHEDTRGLLRAEMASAHAETRLHFDSTIDRFESTFDLIGEGIRNIDEKLDREAADIRAEMRQGFSDTHALIRFSHKQRIRRAKSRRPTTPAPKPKMRRTKTKTTRAKTTRRAKR